MLNIAVILAGGSGSRTGLDQPKQFVTLGGKTVLEHSVQAFQDNAGIDRIIIVAAARTLERVRQMQRSNHWNKVTDIIPGGAERYNSTLAAIDACRDLPECNLIFHDAARPLVSQRIITDTVKAMETCLAIDVAVPSTDTVVETAPVSPEEEIGNSPALSSRTAPAGKAPAGTAQTKSDLPVIGRIPDRRLIWREQTPQAFRKSIIEEAYRRALKDPEFVSTDDCGTVVRYMPDVPVCLVRGEERNLKFTYAEDIPVLELLLKSSGS